MYSAGANGGLVRVDCSNRRWFDARPRDFHHVFSTTPTPMTSRRPPTTPRGFFVMTSSASTERSLADDRHVTDVHDGDWSRRGVVERPVYGDEDDADTSRKARTDAVDFNTVRHWLKYSEQGEEEAAATAAAGAERPRPVYRELVDDVDEDLDDVDDGLVHRHDAERPSDAVVHVHHVHEVDDHAVSVVEASKSSPLSLIHI